MTKLQLIDAVQSRDLATLQALIEAGTDVNEQDEQGWTPLSWAAGKGDLAAVRLLIDNGADVFKTGRDQRTPYMIALAAGHVEIVQLLQQAEAAINANASTRREVTYCQAFPVGQLRRFTAWKESSSTNGHRSLADEDLVFLHQDYSVTESMWHNENVIFSDESPAWREFCTNELGFKVPTEIELALRES
jgi:uncharacterized protein